jgi:hypothetical protein
MILISLICGMYYPDASKSYYTMLTSCSCPKYGKTILRHVFYLGIVEDIPGVMTCDDVSGEV